ncbi:hypothetical protein KAI31_02140 [Candidatus Bathyarchaeota archaeon]|nr:hypothetical protein [Candidatus Bathyarchaeota archaeon]
MTGWLRREIQQAVKREERKFVESMRPASKVVWMVPVDAPCNGCMQIPGNAICQNKCPYYPELIRMRDSGELSKVVKE